MPMPKGPIFHNLHVYLYANKLEPARGKKTAKVLADRSLTVEDLARSAAERGETTLDARTIANAVEAFFYEMGFALCDGFNVNTSWFNVHTEIRGTFNGNETTLDPARHSVSACFQPGIKLQEMYEHVDVKIEKHSHRDPRITSVTDNVSGIQNQQLTLGQCLTIDGQQIKVSGNGETVGLYFINVDTGETAHLPERFLIVNTPRQIVCLVPELPHGKYRIRIITEFRRNRHDSSAIIIDHDAELTVADNPATK